jgi:hypothetical protein
MKMKRTDTVDSTFKENLPQFSCQTIHLMKKMIPFSTKELSIGLRGSRCR